MYSIETYRKILNVSEKATLDDIKHAYRSKAKLLHPDKNKAPDAHEQFILLTEAYEFLRNARSKNVVSKDRMSSYTDWHSQRREQARQQAKRYAQMRYDEFINSDYYKSVSSIEIIFDGLIFLFACSILIILPIVATLVEGWTGFGGSMLVIFVTLPFTIKTIREFLKNDPGKLGSSILFIIKTKSFKYLLGVLINIILFFRFALNTELPLWAMLGAIIGIYSISFLCYRYYFSARKTVSRQILFLLLTPGIFNLFFAINFLFSSNPQIEVYSFVHEKRWYGGGRFNRESYLDKTAYIDLPDGKYEQVYWFRMFFDFEAMKFKTEITYTFEDGLFGLRVLKKFEFTN
ncbi:MAG: DnaJ domain-containing protein [Bacteroidia bacterium]